MAFNPDPESGDLQALNTEVFTDPISMGYDPDGKTKDLLDLLNLPENNAQPQSSNRVFDIAAMLDALVPTDYGISQVTQGAPEYTNSLILGRPSVGQIAPYRDKWRAMFPDGSATAAALDAQQSELSRAEVLFGQGTVITRDDWLAARDV